MSEQLIRSRADLERASQILALDPSSAYRREITLRDLVAEIRNCKATLLIVIVMLTAGGALLGLLVPREYQASTVLSPVAQDSSSLGGAGSLLSQYSGIASLAGISLPGSKEKEEAIAVLQSELLTENYIREKDLLPVLFYKDWNDRTGTWRVRGAKVPTLWEGNRLFRRDIRGVEEGKDGLVTLTIRWKDPKLAAMWANDLVKRTNEYLRNQAIKEAERDITYLNDQAAKTNVIEVRNAIYSLLQAQIKQEMIARGRDEYALKVVDPAFVPEKPSSPGPVLLSILGFGLGCTAAFLIVLGRRIFIA